MSIPHAGFSQYEFPKQAFVNSKSRSFPNVNWPDHFLLQKIRRLKVLEKHGNLAVPAAILLLLVVSACHQFHLLKIF